MIISKTPLRVSFFGGGTDLEEYYRRSGGVVVSTAVSKFVYVIVKPNYFSGDIVLNYFEKEKVASVHEIKHNIIRECLILANITNSVEIISFMDLPLQGTGLGSSSAFTVGLLNALFAYQGRILAPSELAEFACHIEIDILKEPIGKQDQYACSFGGLREYVFAQDGKVHVHELKLEQEHCEVLNSHMVLFHTGLERKSSSVLSDQKQRMEKNFHHLNELAVIARTSKDLFTSLNIKKIGELLNVSWERKKKLSEKIQNELIEHMYDTGMKAGAYGGKLLGAGGGGFFCFLCPPHFHANLRSALKDFKELPIAIELCGSRVNTFKD